MLRGALLLAGLTLLLLLAGWLVPPLSRRLRALDWPSLVALHVVRLVGLYIVWLQGEGRLPDDFAVPGGLGDVAIAALAVVLVRYPQLVSEKPSVLLFWNLAGLADLLFAVTTALRLGGDSPTAVAELLRLPLVLVPIVLVPVLLTSHVWLFAKWRALPRPTPPPGR